MYIDTIETSQGFPKQRVSFRTKNSKSWQVGCVDYGANRNILNSSIIRQSVIHKQVNYDLINGKLHIEDLKLLINPNGLDLKFGDVDGIQHYPIMNTKLQVLRGEESARPFDYKVLVTDPNSISQKERDKKQQIMQRLQQLVEAQAPADGEQPSQSYEEQLNNLQNYFSYEWQDIREMRANTLLNHYTKELNLPVMFNAGFMDAMVVGEELYQVYIDHGEPCVRKLNPSKVRVYQSGHSNKIEDAGMIVIEEYLSKEQIVDLYYDLLTKKDYDYIMSCDLTRNSIVDEGYYNPGFDNSSVNVPYVFTGDNGTIELKDVDGVEPSDFWGADYDEGLLPYDLNGNIRVCQVYWKTLRLVKQIKYYDPITGQKAYKLVPETYIANKEKGEEEKKFWINEAWQGTKIGDNVYVNIGPCPVQFNKRSNPSFCHFGIIGSIYNLNDDRPYSLVDIMKPYNYAYDVLYDRLNKLIARNYGKIIKLDLAKVPNKWGMDKWINVLKRAGIAVEDSFKEGKSGMAKGKLAGQLNNASSGVVDAELGQSIAQQIQFLEFIKNEMSRVVGVSDQREGQIQNRETVGGVERSVLQSSHITEWLFLIHDDVKKRVMECLLEMAKACLRGNNEKFQYILSDFTAQIVDVDGDEYCESEYGLVIDNSYSSQELVKNLPMLVQAGIQNGTSSLSAAMKLYNATSRAEKQRILENDERQLREFQQQQVQAQQETQQRVAQIQQETQLRQMEHEAAMNTENNETKIIVANIQAQSKLNVPISEPDNSMSEAERAKLEENKRQFDLTHKLNQERLNFDKDKAQTDAELKRKQINKTSHNAGK